MRPIDTHFADYAAHHRHALNKATHTFGIPMIAIALLGLTGRITLYAFDGLTINLALLIAAAVLLTYVRWHAGLALGFAVLTVPAYLLGMATPIRWLWGILAIGLVLQYVGHLVFEGKSPAFHKNAVHTLVGPLWMAALLFSVLRIYRFRD